MTLNTKPETISQYCMVSSVMFKKTKTGKDYAELTLSDKTATIPACKVWDVTEEVKEILKNYDVLYVDGEADNFGGSYKVTIKNVSLPSGEVPISELVPSEPIDVEGIYSSIKAEVESFQNELLKKATLGLLEEYGEALKKYFSSQTRPPL